MANISKSLFSGPKSYFVTEGPTGRVETDCFTCQHCNKVVFCCDRITKRPKRAEDCGGICNNCKGNICPGCVDQGKCIPLEKAIEMMEERDRRAREYGI